MSRRYNGAAIPDQRLHGSSAQGHAGGVSLLQPAEIDSSELTAQILRDAIHGRGCLLVRGLISPETADALQQIADPVFAARAAHIDGAPLDVTAPWYVPSPDWNAASPGRAEAYRGFNDQVGAIHIADSPRMLDALLSALTPSGVFSVITEYLGEPLALSTEKTMLRRVPPDAKPTFHQDGSFMGPGTRAVNTWLALSHCGAGTDAPGLAVLPCRFDTSLTGYPDGFRTFEAAEWDAATANVAPAYPTFAPGDALMFDELLVHGNGGGRPGLSRHRYAIEMWTFAREGLPASYVPIPV